MEIFCAVAARIPLPPSKRGNKAFQIVSECRTERAIELLFIELGNTSRKPVAASAHNQEHRIGAWVGRHGREDVIDLEVAVGREGHQARVVRDHTAEEPGPHALHAIRPNTVATSQEQPAAIDGDLPINLNPGAEVGDYPRLPARVDTLDNVSRRAASDWNNSDPSLKSHQGIIG